MSPQTKVSAPASLQKLFLAVNLLYVIATFFVGMRLLGLAYGYQDVQLSSLSLMAISSFTLPIIVFVSMYFVALRSGTRLHRAFISAIFSTIFTTLYGLFILISFWVSYLPILWRPMPINPYEILSTIIILLLLIGTVWVLRSRWQLASELTSKQSLLVGLALIVPFVADQLFQLIFSGFSRTTVVVGALTISSLLLGGFYLAARARKASAPFFYAVIATTVTIQAFMVLSTIYSVSPTN